MIIEANVYFVVCKTKELFLRDVNILLSIYY